MKKFLTKFSDKIMGVLNGFDRLLFRGTLLGLAYVEGFVKYLNVNRVLRKDFRAFAEKSTERVKEASLLEAQERKRPIEYPASSQIDKEAEARKIAERDGIRQGLVCVLTCLEPCESFSIARNPKTQQWGVTKRRAKCLHLYQYRIHPEFGWMYTRLQSWFPFSLQVYVNGREWLARRMDREGIAYQRRDNRFVWIENPTRVKRWAQQQRKFSWRAGLNSLVQKANPALSEILGAFEAEYKRQGESGTRNPEFRISGRIPDSDFWILNSSGILTAILAIQEVSLEQLRRPA